MIMRGMCKLCVAGCDACDWTGQEPDQQLRERIIERLKGEEQDDATEVFGPPEVEVGHGYLDLVRRDDKATIEKAKELVTKTIKDLMLDGLILEHEIEGDVVGKTINVRLTVRGLLEGPVPIDFDLSDDEGEG